MDAVGFGALQERHVAQARRTGLHGVEQAPEHAVVGVDLLHVAPAGDQLGPLVQRGVDEVGDAADLRPKPGTGRVVREVGRHELSAAQVVWPAARHHHDFALRLRGEALGHRDAHEARRARN